MSATLPPGFDDEGALSDRALPVKGQSFGPKLTRSEISRKNALRSSRARKPPPVTLAKVQFGEKP